MGGVEGTESAHVVMGRDAPWLRDNGLCATVVVVQESALAVGALAGSRRSSGKGVGELIDWLGVIVCGI